MTAKWAASQLRALANWLDPPRNELYITIHLDASEFLDGIDMIKRRLNSPCIRGDVP